MARPNMENFPEEAARKLRQEVYTFIFGLSDAELKAYTRLYTLGVSMVELLRYGVQPPPIEVKFQNQNQFFLFNGLMAALMSNSQNFAKFIMGKNREKGVMYAIEVEQRLWDC